MMLDHSNQIGTEKVLVALGVNASSLPEAGKSLKHADVRVLEVKPGSPWTAAHTIDSYESPRSLSAFGPPKS